MFEDWYDLKILDWLKLLSIFIRLAKLFIIVIKNSRMSVYPPIYNYFPDKAGTSNFLVNFALILIS